MSPHRETLVEFLLRDAPSPLTARELMKALRVGRAGEAAFLAALEERVRAGELVELKGGQYAHPSRVGLVVGRLQIHPDGFGFVIPDDREEPDLYIKPRWLRAAMNGDRVVARVERREHRPEGRVIRVLSRANEKVIGRVQVRKKVAAVVPLDERLLHEIYVGWDDLLGAVDGQVVQVELTEFPTEETGPQGRVVLVLGHPGEAEVESKAIALKHGVRVEFAPDVVAEAEASPDQVRAQDLRGRKDLRGLPFVTIDGEKARDFDDAVCVEEGSDGRARLWVAIADVSYYVKEGTALDQEAYARGTSTYFPDRVFPMLPEALSNGICSLNPMVDRLVMVAELVYSRGGRRQSASFYPAVIRSRHRLTYTVVGKILDDPDSDAAPELSDALPMLLRMGELARAIRARRRDRGSIDFDLPEAEIVLDLQGRPEDVVRSERNWAHYLIEEFMIAANEAVAEFLEEARIPCPFRTHGEPSAERMEEFRRFVHNFGYTLKVRQKPKPQDFQDLSRQVEGKPEERMIHQMMLRTMKKAEYSPVNVGHFGLASTHYAHFTSPIRRYPDLVLHRHLRAALQPKKAQKTWRARAEAYLDEACPHLSTRERASESAEREAVTWKKCQFMADKVGGLYWGFISGVASFGFFVQLEDYFVDGLVHVSSLRDDFYQYAEEMQALVGERTNRRFRIGDRLHVRVDRVGVERRQIDFTLAAPATREEAKRKEARAEPPRAERGRGGRSETGVEKEAPAPREGRPGRRKRSRSGGGEAAPPPEVAQGGERVVQAPEEGRPEKEERRAPGRRRRRRGGEAAPPPEVAREAEKPASPARSRRSRRPGKRAR
ncbi:MAG: ribonuclease R [Deltaproteobacteria bacterium]|nr:ribonuclease R [Deltaproteobacteria bacterium]